VAVPEDLSAMESVAGGQDDGTPSSTVSSNRKKARTGTSSSRGNMKVDPEDDTSPLKGLLFSDLPELWEKKNEEKDDGSSLISVMSDISLNLMPLE
jgi:hypothetical protein